MPVPSGFQWQLLKTIFPELKANHALLSLALSSFWTGNSWPTYKASGIALGRLNSHRKNLKIIQPSYPTAFRMSTLNNNMDAIILTSSPLLAAWIGRITGFKRTVNALSNKEKRNIFNRDGSAKFENVILAIQNYKEIWADCIQRKLNKKTAHDHLMVKYINNIIAHHTFSGDKMIVRFEDVLADYQQEGQRILSFIKMKKEIPNPKLEKLGNDMDPKLRLKIDHLYSKRLGRLYETYLAGYADLP
jgi:hypothetical protein